MNKIPQYSPIEGHPLYLACSDGYVINVDTGYVLNGSEKRTGYIEICLRDKNGKPHYKMLHRIIANAFCERRRKNTEVNHIDGNKQNNRADNLEWVTHAENLQHAYESGLRNDNVAPRVVFATDVLTGDVLRFKSIYEASHLMGVSQGNICMCCKGNRPSASGYFWEYEDQKKLEQD